MNKKYQYSIIDPLSQAASNGASTAHAEQCAELCAERILAIVEKKLSAKQTDA